MNDDHKWGALKVSNATDEKLMVTLEIVTPLDRSLSPGQELFAKTDAFRSLHTEQRPFNSLADTFVVQLARQPDGTLSLALFIPGNYELIDGLNKIA